MAEDSIDIPETSEKLELKGAHPRRYSTGNLSLPKVGADVLPRYLGTSVTSCHELCKLGVIHEPLEKPWLRKPKRNPTKPGEHQDLVKDVLTSIVEGKKKPAIKNEPLPASPKKLAVSSPHSSSPTAKTSAKNASGLRPRALERTSSVPGDSKSRTFSGISIKKSSSGTTKLLKKPNSEKASDVPEKIIHTVDTKPENLTRKGNKTAVSSSQLLSPSPENKKLKDIQKSSRASLISSLSLSPRKLRPTRNESPSSSPSVKKLPPIPIKKAENDSLPDDSKTEVTDDCKVKNVGSLEDVVRNGDDQASPSPSTGETKKSRRARNGSQTSLSSSTSSIKKILTPARKGSSSSSSTPSLKLRSRLPVRTSGSKPTSESENKTLNQVKSTVRSRRVKIVSLEDKVRAPKKPGTRPGKASSLPSEEASESTKDVEIDPNSGSSGTKGENETPDIQVKRPGRHRRVRSAGLEDEVGSPKKLHFRRGKVVDIQPKNTVIPRILKFRQRLLLGENQNGRSDAWRRTMKKLVGGDESSGVSSGGTVKVALRHQNIEGKKESKSLFNNVIEETAILLAQTRKSKVKALVGAFETVISLQDKKSSTT